MEKTIQFIFQFIYLCNKNVLNLRLNMLNIKILTRTFFLTIYKFFNYIYNNWQSSISKINHTESLKIFENKSITLNFYILLSLTLESATSATSKSKTEKRKILLDLWNELKTGMVARFVYS